MRLYLWIGGAALLASLGVYVYIQSLRLDSAEKERDAALAAVALYSEQLEREREEILRVNLLLSDLETKEAEIRYVDRVVQKEIVKYRDRAVNRCQLSDDWVCVYNTSAQGLPAGCGSGQVQN